MTTHEVLNLFKSKAQQLGDDHRTEESAISRFAQFLADSESRLSTQDFDILVNMGAMMYKHGFGQFAARADVASVVNRTARHMAKD